MTIVALGAPGNGLDNGLGVIVWIAAAIGGAGMYVWVWWKRRR